MNFSIKAIITATLLLFSTTDIIRRHDVDDAKYLALGEKYGGAVVKLTVGNGTLIRPTWIISAAHVVSSDRVGNEVTIDGEVYKFKQKIIHPGFRTSGGSVGVDIALIELETPVKGHEMAKLYSKSDEVGKEIIFAGTGWAGTGVKGMAEGEINKDRKLRAAQNRIEGTRADGYISFTFDSPDSGKALPLEGISGPGDSGGPALLFENHEVYILGVSSHQDGKGMGRPEGRYGVDEFYARVSVYNDWLKEKMGEK
jgi:trypsin